MLAEISTNKVRENLNWNSALGNDQASEQCQRHFLRLRFISISLKRFDNSSTWRINVSRKLGTSSILQETLETGLSSFSGWQGIFSMAQHNNTVLRVFGYTVVAAIKKKPDLEWILFARQVVYFAIGRQIELKCVICNQCTYSNEKGLQTFLTEIST